jgi:hypothetical protein
LGDESGPENEPNRYNGGFTAPLIGFLFGWLVWKGGVIARFIYLMGRDVDLKVLPEHPDRCGGLRSMGTLRLLLALLVLVPAIFLGFWGILVQYLALSGFQEGASLYGEASRRWLLVMVLAGFFLFLQPLYAIHRRMERKRMELQRELADLSTRIDQISTELRTQAETMTPAQGKERLDQLEFMDKIYQRAKDFPTWPLERETWFTS